MKLKNFCIEINLTKKRNLFKSPKITSLSYFTWLIFNMKVAATFLCLLHHLIVPLVVWKIEIKVLL